MISFLRSFLLVIALFFIIDFSFGVQKASAHGVQIGYGVLSNGYIRVYVEHWHSDNPGSLSSSPLQIKVTVGNSTFTNVYSATGIVANTEYNNLPGLGTSIIVLAICPDLGNTYKDWVYYDFAPPACDVPLTLEILQGTTVVTTEACPILYPQTITKTFNDASGPTPDIAVLPTITGECSATITSAPTATDNCSGPTVGITSDPLTYTEQGTYVVTWTYTDDNNYSTQQTQTVIVNDVSAPVPDIANLPVITGECSAAVTEIPTATDACVGQIIGTTSDPLTYTVNGSYTVNWSFDDLRGNVSHQSQTVNVVNLAPVPDVAELPNAVGECSITLSAPTATDACSGQIIGTTTDPTTYSLTGDYTVTWTYDDGSGNISSQTQNVSVVDNAPVPDIAELEDAIGECSVSLSAPTATDLCSGVITGTTTDPVYYDQQGSYSVTWTYDDGNGNLVSQSQNVLVQDVTPPVITAANSLLTLWSPNHKYETVGLSDFGLNVTDNCAGVSTSSLVITKVTSDEAENSKGSGDGNTVDDIVIADDFQSVDLRKEREGTGNGRVYTIYVSLGDGHGNIGSTSFQVQVPHDKKDTAVYDGDVFVVNGGSVQPVSTISSSAAIAEISENKVSENKIESISENTASANNTAESKALPEGYELSQNYPNPFNPSTTISFAVPEAGYYSLRVFNTLGQQVSQLVSGQLQSGYYNYSFDASKLTSGLYIYTLQGNNVNISKKMILMK